MRQSFHIDIKPCPNFPSERVVQTILKEIRCVHFSHLPIKFRPGLNIILGDDDAKNSIGKSTVLMVIDFVFGGSTFTGKDDAGAICELGPHRYDYSF
jgi:hypothetical protein